MLAVDPSPTQRRPKQTTNKGAKREQNNNERVQENKRSVGKGKKPEKKKECAFYGLRAYICIRQLIKESIGCCCCCYREVLGCTWSETLDVVDDDVESKRPHG